MLASQVNYWSVSSLHQQLGRPAARHICTPAGRDRCVRAADSEARALESATAEDPAATFGVTASLSSAVGSALVGVRRFLNYLVPFGSVLCRVVLRSCILALHQTSMSSLYVCGYTWFFFQSVTPTSANDGDLIFRLSLIQHVFPDSCSLLKLYDFLE